MERKNAMRFGYYFMIIALLTACSSDKPDEKQTQQGASVEGAVAQVGERFITKADVDAEFLLLLKQYQAKKDDKKLRGQVLQGLIDRLVLVEKAKQLGVEDDAAVQAKVRRATQQIIISELQRRREMGDASEAMIEDYYKRHPKAFTEPEKVHVRQVLVRSESNAASVLRKLGRGESFESVVERMSVDKATRDKGGEMEPFTHGMVLPEIEDAVFALEKPGDRTDVVKSPYGLHVFELIEKTPARLLPLEEVRGKVEGLIRSQSQQAWLNQVKSEIEVRIF